MAKMASYTSTTPPRQRESGRTALPGRPRLARAPCPWFTQSFGTELETSMGRARELLITGITRNGLVTSY